MISDLQKSDCGGFWYRAGTKKGHVYTLLHGWGMNAMGSWEAPLAKINAIGPEDTVILIEADRHDRGYLSVPPVWHTVGRRVRHATDVLLSDEVSDMIGDKQIMLVGHSLGALVADRLLGSRDLLCAYRKQIMNSPVLITPVIPTFGGAILLNGKYWKNGGGRSLWRFLGALPFGMLPGIRQGLKIVPKAVRGLLLDEATEIQAALEYRNDIMVAESAWQFFQVCIFTWRSHNDHPWRHPPVYVVAKDDNLIDNDVVRKAAARTGTHPSGLLAVESPLDGPWTQPTVNVPPHEVLELDATHCFQTALTRKNIATLDRAIDMAWSTSAL